MPNISWMFSGESQGYHINMDGEQIHFTKDVYERDMFISELKGRLKIAAEQLLQLDSEHNLP